MSNSSSKYKDSIVLLPKTSAPLSPEDGEMYYDSVENKFKKYENGQWSDIGDGGSSGINYIENGSAENDTAGWVTYKLSEAVTFQDAGDTVTLTSHGLQNGNTISFTVITSTTGITIDTLYYVVNAATNTFQVSSTPNGSALTLTTNGSGTLVRSRPVTGAGGSPTITWTRSTVSPLRGLASFLGTKDAVNRMGEGVSYDFTIDRADQGKMLQISADFEVASGTYDSGTSSLDSELIIYIYDVTNSRLIEPAGFKVQSGFNIRATFQTPINSTSYRLIIHQALPSTSAYTVKFDNFIVGPQVTSNGYAGSDWKDFPSVAAGTLITATTTNPTYGTVVVNAARYRYVGENAEIEWEYVQSASGTNGTGMYLFNIPSSIGVIDTTKKPVNTSSVLDATAKASTVGYALFRNNAEVFAGDVAPYSGSQLKIAVGGLATSGVFGSGYFGFGSGLTGYYIRVTVPIVGRSSNVVASSETDTRVVAARFSTASARTTNNTSPTIIYETVERDTHGAYNAATGEYTVPVPGDYDIKGFFSMTATATTINHANLLRVFVNGSLSKEIAGVRAYSTTAVNHNAGGSTIITGLKCRDILTFRFYSDTANTLAASNAQGNYIALARLSGPAQVVATEDINARVSGNPASASVGNPIIWPTVDWDTHGCYSASTGLYTPQISGKFQIDGFLLGTGVSITYSACINGTADVDCGFSDGTGRAKIGATVRVLAGQTISIEPNGTTDISSGFMTIKRVGNY